MSRMTPAHEPEPVDLEFTFKLAPEWIDQHVIKHGTKPAGTYTFAVTLSELPTPELRKRFLEAHRRYTRAGVYAYLREPSDDSEKVLRSLERWLEAQPPPQGAFTDEMTQWIAEHGSLRLRTAHERGYKVNATYARERAAHEFPRYWVDTNGSAVANERTDPTLEALDAETDERQHAVRSGHTGLTPVIVWLLRPPADLTSALKMRNERFERCEAIHIASYLGRYSLYLPLLYPREEE